MTQDELVDLGKVLAAVRRLEDSQRQVNGTVNSLQATVSNQTSQIMELHKTNQHLATEIMRLRSIVKRLPCADDPESEERDTDPDCPAILSEAPPSHRPKLRSITETEPDSVVTRPISVHAGPLQLRGPGIVIGVLVVTIVAAYVLLAGWMHL